MVKNEIDWDTTLREELSRKGILLIYISGERDDLVKLRDGRFLRKFLCLCQGNADFAFADRVLAQLIVPS